MRCIIFFLLLFLFIGYTQCDLNPDFDKVTVSNDFEKRSRIIMLDRNMWIHAGSDGNITLSTSSGGRIFFDEVDANTLTYFASFQSYSNRIKKLEHGYWASTIASMNWRHVDASLSYEGKMIKQHDENMTEELKNIQTFKRNQTLLSDQLKSRLAYWRREVEELEKKLNNSACQSNQCANGGVCIPRIGDTFTCLCSQYYSGDKCEDDVDECSEFNQCQNEGICVNIRDGFRCDCKEGFHGSICQYQQSTCSETTQLCGPHGACVSMGDTSYDCHCHVGFKKSDDPKNPTCVDVDECLTNPCHPEVECINLDGSYQCFGCPPGYKMGHTGCVDINECNSIGACAKNVVCRNLLGSYECDPCPRGYSGDSKKRCTKETPCTPNPCPGTAICLENDRYDNPDGYICVCGEPLIFNSESGGCEFDVHWSCPGGICLNGAQCESINATDYKCNCDRGYVGKHCEHASPCFSNPCKNGVCQIRNEKDHVCLCDPHYYGDFCEFEETMFDVHLTYLSGVYSFVSPTNHTQITQNTYLNIAQPDSLLKITFTSFTNFTDGKDKLILYDGRDENSHILKTFYGEKTNAPVIGETITMTTTFALLKFIGIAGEYEISYQVVPRGCGYRTSKPKGHLAIPEHKYDDFVSCEWFISAPMDKLIKIRIPSLAVHSGKQIDCNQNKLEVYDGLTLFDQTSIEKICSNVQDPYPLISTGPFLTVSFVSEILPPSKNSSRMSGFSLAYEFIEREGLECGFEIDNKNQIIGLRGYIESPNYGSLYPPNTKCYWRIFGAGRNNIRNDFVIKITFDSFDIPSSKLPRRRSKRSLALLMVCERDNFMISGTIGEFRLPHKCCNEFHPLQQLTIQGDATIEFSSDDSIQGKGFRLRYEVVCEQEIRGNGSIQTWNFPNGGSAGKCVYTINAESYQTVEVKFKSIKLNVLFEHECASRMPTENATNYVEIGGELKEGPLRFTCQNDDFIDNGVITVSGHKPVTITVVSDGNPKFRGISFEYLTYESECGGLVEGDFFTSPEFPFNYPPNSKCIYQIKSNDAIVITFEEFDLTAHPENQYECKKDRIEIHDVTGKLLENSKYCGSVIPPPITITRGMVNIIFYSGDITSTGFRARVERIKHSERTKCDHTITSPEGFISFDSKHLSSCRSFSWHITFQRFEMIHLTINNMNVPCKTSNLEIFDGHSQESGGYIYKSCLHQNIQNIQTMSNRATIVFNRTSNEPASFKITYEKLYGCYIHKNSFSGFISAPQYPHRERREADCYWDLTASSGNQLQLTIKKMDDLVMVNEKCTIQTGNVLEVHKLSNLHDKSASYCHKTDENIVVTSEQNILGVRYLQNMDRPSSVFGFLAHFTTVCKDIVLTQPHGIIQSPGYPDNVPIDLQCSWTIRVPIGNRIVIKFSEFDVQIEEDGQDCSLNKFSIDDGDMKSSVISNVSGIFDSTDHWFCESKSPVELQTRHNIAHLYYKSTVQSNKFELHYHTLGCVKEIRTSENIKITRDMVDLDNEYFECQYTITAPADKRINLVINSFDIAHNDDCKYSPDGSFRGLAIFMGSSNFSGNPQQTICSKNSHFEYKSHTSQMFVYVSLNGRSINPDRQVFLDASVTFMDPELGDRCGARIDLTHKHQETLMSPNYPSIYPSQVFCAYLITADFGYHVNIELKEFHVPNEKNSQKSSRVHLENAPKNGMITITNMARPTSENFTYIQISDQKSASEPIKYTSHEAFVTFQGADTTLLGEIDRQQKITGFLMTVKQVCGGIVYVEPEEKTLKLQFESGQNCTVVIKSEGGDEGIHAGIEVFTMTNSSSDHSFFSDRIHIFIDDSLSEDYSTIDTYAASYNAEKEIRFEYRTRSQIKHHAIIKYSSTIDGCKKISQQKYTEFSYTSGKQIDCSYIIENTPGSTVHLELMLYDFPSSPHCAESYVEVRESNATGKLLSHSCSQLERLTFEQPSLYFHLKYEANFVDRRFLIDVEITRKYGGQTKSPLLKSPKIIKQEVFEWNLDSLDKPHILIRTSGVALSSNSYIKFKQSDDDRKTDDAYDKIILGLPSDETFILNYKTALIEVKMVPNDEFTIEWEAIDENDYNKTISKTSLTSKYDCGRPLTPTWEWQEITSPLPPGQASGYEDNIHCMWTMKREHLAGFEIKFEHLDLEYDPECLKDYVIVHEDIDSQDIAMRLCDLSRMKDSYYFTYQELLYIHFVTDNSGGGTGFKMLYRLSCKVEFTLPMATNLVYAISNPPDAQDCWWHITSKKRRPISIEIQSLHIGESEDCYETNSLIFTSFDSEKEANEICGKFENLKMKNIPDPHPQIYVTYKSDGTLKDQGFKLILQEVAVECPEGTIYIDRETWSRTIYSPEYPKEIPHSSECDYVVSVPQGYRVELNFEPNEFDLQDGPANDTKKDYLEVRDGASEHSTLIGRYRGKTPPSSIFSTGNFMFMRLHTDDYENSRKFAAHFKIAWCGGTIIIDEKDKEYPIATPKHHPMACRWKVRTANTHMIMVKIVEQWGNSNKNVCDAATWLNVYDGNLNSSVKLYSKNNCDDDLVVHQFKRSSSSEVAIFYNGGFDERLCSTEKCGFKIIVKMSEEKCGGTIKNDQGKITLPGFPGKLLPHVKCVWNFKTDPGNVYELKFRFTEKSNFNTKKGCYEDIEFFDLSEEPNFEYYDEHRSNGKIFCENSLTTTSIMDRAVLVYDDQATLALQQKSSIVEDTWYSPFEITYRTIPAEYVDTSCTSVVNQNHTFSLNPATKLSALNFTNRCHLAIRKPSEFGTVHVKINNFNNTKRYSCVLSDLYLALKSDGPIDLGFDVCEFDENSMIFINPSIDVFVHLERLEIEKRNDISIGIEFQECGGHIKEPVMDNITSPNYMNSRYLCSSKCRWLLEAPVGQVIRLRVVEMDIYFDYDCKNDRLMIGEGRQDELNILHTYCHTTENRLNSFKEADHLDEHFKQITSKTRFISIVWITDSSRNAAGWKLEYEFVNEGEACGNHQKGMSGVIHTSNYSVQNYGQNQECIWDIEVPFGYHIQLHYTYFKVEPSTNCENDGLYISQLIHHAGKNRAGDSFSTKTSIDESPLCGLELPPDYNSQSRKLRLTFKSNDRLEEKGFHLSWKAICGMTYNSTHGIIKSPEFTSMEDGESCEYSINAKPNDHISLKIEYFDLLQWGEDAECDDADYIEIEIRNSGYRSKYCKAMAPKDGMLLVGPITIRFVRSRLYGNRKGFKFVYTINECGGNIHLEEGAELSKIIQHERFGSNTRLDCVWNISTTPDRELVVKFEYFYMKEYACHEEFIELFDSPYKNASLGVYCGGPETMPNHVIQSSGPNLLLHAYSNTFHGPWDSDNPKMFKVIVTSTPGAKSGCGGILEATEKEQFLSPPKDKSGFGYSKHISCGWLIKAPRFHQIKIVIQQTQMRCRTDKFMIYDGKEGLSAELLSNPCVFILEPLEKTSSGDQLFVRFSSREGHDRIGFKLAYSLHFESCGGWSQADDLQSTSSMDIENAANCRRYIEGNSVDPIFIRFFKVDISKDDCKQDYIEVRDVGSPVQCQHPACVKGVNQRTVTKYCGGDQIPSHISTTNTMMVTIRVSKKAYISFGYLLLNNCNRTIDTTELASGFVESRNTSDSQCVTTFENSLNETQSKKVLIVFNSFGIYNVTESNINKTLYHPSTYFSQGGDSVKIISGVNTIYQASFYTVIKEEANYTEFSPIYTSDGVVSNAEHWNTYMKSMTQVFTIQPPKSQLCKFVANKSWHFDKKCDESREYILIQRILNNDVIGEEKFTKCNIENFQDFSTSKGQRVRFTFVTDDDSSNDGNGFKMYWKCHDDNMNY